MQKYLVLPCIDRDYFCMYFFILCIFFNYYKYSVYGGYGGSFHGNYRVL